MSRNPCSLLLAAIALLLNTGCRTDVVVHPPEDRYRSSFPPPLESFIGMEQSEAVRNIVSGVGSEVVDGGRWAGHRAVLRFHCVPLDELRFHAAFVLPEALLARAGRVVLRVAVEGEPLHEAEYSAAGPQEIQKKMTKGSFTFERETEVALEMSVPSGGVPAAETRYLLTSAGFRF